MPGHSIVLAISALFAIPPGISYGQETVPVEQQADFLLRSLEYDQNLKQRCGDAVRVAVVFMDSDLEAAEAVAVAFRRYSSKGVQGLPVEAASVEFQTVARLLKRMDDEELNAIFVHASAASALVSIQQVSRALKLPTMVGARKLVERGAALGVRRSNDSIKPVVNLRASRIEGLKFGASFLAIAEVIR